MNYWGKKRCYELYIHPIKLIFNFPNYSSLLSGAFLCPQGLHLFSYFIFMRFIITAIIAIFSMVSVVSAATGSTSTGSTSTGVIFTGSTTPNKGGGGATIAYNYTLARFDMLPQCFPWIFASEYFTSRNSKGPSRRSEMTSERIRPTPSLKRRWKHSSQLRHSKRKSSKKH